MNDWISLLPSGNGCVWMHVTQRRPLPNSEAPRRYGNGKSAFWYATPEWTAVLVNACGAVLAEVTVGGTASVNLDAVDRSTIRYVNRFISHTDTMVERDSRTKLYRMVPVGERRPRRIRRRRRDDEGRGMSVPVAPRR